MRNKKDAALNPDLWEQLLNLTSIHEMEYNWVKGHAGHPENERCDKMAVEYYQKFIK
jgi:ribonuclease HI